MFLCFSFRSFASFANVWSFSKSSLWQFVFLSRTTSSQAATRPGIDHSSRAGLSVTSSCSPNCLEQGKASVARSACQLALCTLRLANLSPVRVSASKRTISVPYSLSFLFEKGNSSLLINYHVLSCWWLTRSSKLAPRHSPKMSHTMSSPRPVLIPLQFHFANFPSFSELSWSVRV